MTRLVDKSPPPVNPEPPAIDIAVEAFPAREVTRLVTCAIVMVTASVPPAVCVLAWSGGVTAATSRESVARTACEDVPDPFGAKSTAIVPTPVIVPPVNPVPAVIAETAPALISTPEVVMLSVTSDIRPPPHRC
jgi:hypothetical protein